MGDDEPRLPREGDLCAECRHLTDSNLAAIRRYRKTGFQSKLMPYNVHMLLDGVPTPHHKTSRIVLVRFFLLCDECDLLESGWPVGYVFEWKGPSPVLDASS